MTSLGRARPLLQYRLGENHLDIDGAGNGVIVVEGARGHADREEECAEELLSLLAQPKGLMQLKFVPIESRHTMIC
jgi:hypothetical protein